MSNKVYKYEFLLDNAEIIFNEQEYYKECVELYKSFGKVYIIPTKPPQNGYPPIFALRYFLEKEKKENNDTGG